LIAHLLRPTRRTCLGYALGYALLPIISFAACRSENRPSVNGNVSGPEAAVQTGIYRGKGVVRSINLQRPSIELDHEDIQGLMPAMTMEFYVKDRALLAGLNAGDRVEFIIENGVGGLKITSIRKP
jgi:Cu/Ag efflux protein CusF